MTPHAEFMRLFNATYTPRSHYTYTHAMTHICYPDPWRAEESRVPCEDQSDAGECRDYRQYPLGWGYLVVDLPDSV